MDVPIGRARKLESEVQIKNYIHENNLVTAHLINAFVFAPQIV